jgi:hypothetical protein
MEVELPWVSTSAGLESPRSQTKLVRGGARRGKVRPLKTPRLLQKYDNFNFPWQTTTHIYLTEVKKETSEKAKKSFNNLSRGNIFAPQLARIREDPWDNSHETFFQNV